MNVLDHPGRLVLVNIFIIFLLFAFAEQIEWNVIQYNIM